MAPTKDAQRLRRAAERKGKAEDQHQLGILYHFGREGLKQDKVAAARTRRDCAGPLRGRARRKTSTNSAYSITSGGRG